MQIDARAVPTLRNARGRTHPIGRPQRPQRFAKLDGAVAKRLCVLEADAIERTCELDALHLRALGIDRALQPPRELGQPRARIAGIAAAKPLKFAPLVL